MNLKLTGDDMGGMPTSFKETDWRPGGDSNPRPLPQGSNSLTENPSLNRTVGIQTSVCSPDVSIPTTTCAHDIREPISFRTWKNLDGHVIEWQRKTRCLSCGVRVVEEWGR